MIELTSGEGSYYVGSATSRGKKQEVACVSLFKELFLTYVVEAPRLVGTFCTFTQFIALTGLYVPAYFSLPTNTIDSVL